MSENKFEKFLNRKPEEENKEEEQEVQTAEEYEIERFEKLINSLGPTPKSEMDKMKAIGEIRRVTKYDKKEAAKKIGEFFEKYYPSFYQGENK